MRALAIVLLAACGSTPAPVEIPAPVVVLIDAPKRGVPDPSLFADKPAPPVIDWTHDAWSQLAPTGADFETKLGWIPEDRQRALALELLAGGNFQCAAPAPACGAIAEIPSPADAANMSDPCLRRILALWAIGAIEPEDLPALKDAFDRIAALPPPESQLIAAVLKAIPDDQQDRRLELLSIAWRAGQRDLVNGSLDLDRAHLAKAVRDVHVDGALEVLAVEQDRPVYLAAVKDEALIASARIKAIDELVGDDKLAPEVTAAIVAATKAKDCGVAAAAARALEVHGDKRFVPRKPATNNVDALMRGLCVLASYETLQRSDEPSLLPTYLPKRGLERFTFTQDPVVDDPQKAELLDRAEAVLPEIEDLVRAMKHCIGTVCASDDREFRFAWKVFGGQMLLSRVELADRPACKP